MKLSWKNDTFFMIDCGYHDKDVPKKAGFTGEIIVAEPSAKAKRGQS